MSLTEQQKAYHLKKMRTRVSRLDVNKDGVVSRNDFEIMSEKLSSYSKLTEEQTKAVHDRLFTIADAINLKPDVKYGICTNA